MRVLLDTNIIVDVLQRREVQLLKSLAEKRGQLTSQILFDEIIQQTAI